MLPGYSPVLQAFLGTLFTWGLTAAGASLVICIRGSQRKLLDTSLGFAAGVMTAASYWSLLSPAIEMAEDSGIYGKDGKFAFVPVSIGFLAGAFFVSGADWLISKLGLQSTTVMIAMHGSVKKLEQAEPTAGINRIISNTDATTIEGFSHGPRKRGVRGRHSARDYEDETEASSVDENSAGLLQDHAQWKRIMLLVIAITVHNIPEGLAVGVSFGAIGNSASATFESARNLAIGIGIQNFPEGLAVSLPLQAAGFSTWRSLWYGQLSGMVEPIFGVLGAVTVSLAQPALPYALSFAAGAMIYVVIDDIIPEANTNGNGKLATWGSICGFLVMMALDVGLG